VGPSSRATYRCGAKWLQLQMGITISKKKLGQGKTEYDSLHNDPTLSLGSYAYNAKLGGDVSNDAMEENVYKVRLSAVKDGPSTIYFGETDDNVESHGWVFNNVNNAPQGNHKDKVHCCMLDGHVEMILNKHLKEPSSFGFFTEFKDKNYSARPSN